MQESKDDPQILVEENEMESYLKDDWQFVTMLPSQKILIKRDY